MTTTENEKRMLVNIAENLYTELNGAEPREANETDCWVDCLDSGPYDFKSTSIPGIISSLSQKGLVSTDGEVISLTEDGFLIYKGIKEAMDEDRTVPCSECGEKDVAEDMIKIAENNKYACKGCVSFVSPELGHECSPATEIKEESNGMTYIKCSVCEAIHSSYESHAGVPVITDGPLNEAMNSVALETLGKVDERNAKLTQHDRKVIASAMNLKDTHMGFMVPPVEPENVHQYATKAIVDALLFSLNHYSLDNKEIGGLVLTLKKLVSQDYVDGILAAAMFLTNNLNGRLERTLGDTHKDQSEEDRRFVLGTRHGLTTAWSAVKYIQDHFNN